MQNRCAFAAQTSERAGDVTGAARLENLSYDLDRARLSAHALFDGIALESKATPHSYVENPDD